MNLDANIQKILSILLKKWKLIVVFALIGTIFAYIYTANFATLTYSSNVVFLSYVQDSNQELTDSTSIQQQASNTSKINYAIKMLNTYIQLIQTNEFYQNVVDEINDDYGTEYTIKTLKDAITVTPVEDTAMFKVTVTTTDPELSYRIAHQLETSVPEKMESSNNSLITASVEDSAIKASDHESKGYLKKCAIGFVAGAILAAAFIILKDLLDIRIKNPDELSEVYEIPILGTIPEFEIKTSGKGGRTNG